MAYLANYTSLARSDHSVFCDARRRISGYRLHCTYALLHACNRVTGSNQSFDGNLAYFLLVTLPVTCVARTTLSPYFCVICCLCLDPSLPRCPRVVTECIRLRVHTSTARHSFAWLHTPFRMSCKLMSHTVHPFEYAVLPSVQLEARIRVLDSTNSMRVRGAWSRRLTCICRDLSALESFLISIIRCASGLAVRTTLNKCK